MDRDGVRLAVQHLQSLHHQDGQAGSGADGVSVLAHDGAGGVCQGPLVHQLTVVVLQGNKVNRVVEITHNDIRSWADHF